MRQASLVWRFFVRVQENDRTVAVMCKLCDTQYKYFGNTTNLKSHLVRKHPIQWDLLTTGNLEERTRKRLESVDEDDSVTKTVDVEDGDNEGTIHLISDMQDKASDEEWLEDTHQFVTPEPKRKKFKGIKVKQEFVNTSRQEDFSFEQPEQLVFTQAPSPPKDEYSVFGEYVANKLRKIRQPRTRGNLQQLITTMLWQADYGVYDSAEAVKRVLMIPTVQTHAVINAANQIGTPQISIELEENAEENEV